MHLDDEPLFLQGRESLPPVVACDLDHCAAADHIGYGSPRRHAPVDHHDEPVALLGFFHVVRRDKDSCAVLGAVTDVLPKSRPAQWPDARSRLVENKQFGLVGERHREGHPPLEAERKVPDQLVGRAPDALRQDGPRRTEGGSREAPVLENGHVVVETQRLRHVSHFAASAHRREGPEQERIAARGTQQPEQEADEGGLPGTVRAEQPDDLAACDGQIDRVDSREGPEALGHAAGLGEHGHRADPPLVGEGGNDHGVLEVGLHRLGALGQDTRRGPQAPCPPPPPRKARGLGGRIGRPQPAGHGGDDLRGRAGRDRPALVEQSHRRSTVGLTRRRSWSATTAVPAAAAAGDEAPELGTADRVDARRGLVEDEQGRPVQQGHRHRELALHPPREPAPEAAPGAGEPDPFEQFLRAAGELFAGHTEGAPEKARFSSTVRSTYRPAVAGT